MWLMCPVCRKEREVKGNGKLKSHNRWDEKKKMMVSCPGSGGSPVRIGKK
jgi:hypothetical protein